MEVLTQYAVQEIDWPSKTYISIRGTRTFDELPHFFRESYMLIYEALRKAGVVPLDMPCGLYYQVDAEHNRVDLAAAVQVEPGTEKIGYFDRVTIPATKALAVTYYGPYEAMHEAYDELDKYTYAHGLHKQLVVEEYFSDPST
ncbi:MAG TPA: GyrI-like domain-containing protein, partial [Chitinophagaceae bacterium]